MQARTATIEASKPARKLNVFIGDVLIYTPIRYVFYFTVHVCNSHDRYFSFTVECGVFQATFVILNLVTYLVST